jgi:hypothetical protein
MDNGKVLQGLGGGHETDHSLSLSPNVKNPKKDYTPFLCHWAQGLLNHT